MKQSILEYADQHGLDPVDLLVAIRGDWDGPHGEDAEGLISAPDGRYGNATFHVAYLDRIAIMVRANVYG